MHAGIANIWQMQINGCKRFVRIAKFFNMTYHKLMKTPDIAILLKCRIIYAPSGSTLNQFDVSLITLPAGA